MKRTLNFNAGQQMWFWGADCNDTTHLRIKLELDHEVDGNDLTAAWKKTLKVYPLLNWVPDYAKEGLLFYEPDSDPRPVHCDAPVMPYTELAGKRLIAISYCGKSITVTLFHAISDATGIIGVLKTLMYHYCTLHFHKEYDPKGVMLTEGRDVEEYYSSPFRLPLGDYTPQPLASFPIGNMVYRDPDMSPPNPGEIVTSCVTISSEEFIRYCKEHKASPAAMLCILLGKTIYGMYPEERRRICLDVTVDYRKALGLTECLGVFSSAAIICTTYEQIMGSSIEDNALAIREALDKQRTVDYAKTKMDMARTYVILNETSAAISYEGTIDFGSCNDHVTGIFLANNTCNTIHMVEFKGNFILHFQHGKATEANKNAFVAELKKAGISIKAETGIFTIPKEITEIKEQHK